MQALRGRTASLEVALGEALEEMAGERGAHNAELAELKAAVGEMDKALLARTVAISAKEQEHRACMRHVSCACAEMEKTGAEVEEALASTIQSLAGRNEVDGQAYV